jgi:hypothetical protein
VRTSCRSRLRWLLDMSTVAPPPKDDEDILYDGEAASAPVTTILLGLVLLRSDATVVLFEHVALLEGVVDRGFVVRTRLL